MKINEFAELETIFENDHSRVQKARHDKAFYLLKHYKGTLEGSISNERIEREAAILSQIFPDQSRLLDEQNTRVLVMPFQEGVSLFEFMTHWHFSLADYLQIAIELIKQLGNIHLKNILHLDINPSNIVIHPSSKKIAIIDFGSSRFFNQRNLFLSQNELAEYDLNYISPEQTGRIDRIVDFPSDLYSCGAVLYELATGQKLFKTSKPLELVHNHIAKVPTNPEHLNLDLGKPLSAIILKLLAKDPEDRYQSHHGLLDDLRACQIQLEEKGRIEPFPLGLQDINDKFRISKKVYGRDVEIEILEQAFEDTCHGDKKLIFIGGPSGTGKSSLTTLLNKKLTLKKGLFLQGKFDQFTRNTPYAAWGQIFNNFIEWIITQEVEQLDNWKEKLRSRLGNNLTFLAQIIPNLHWLFEDIDEREFRYQAESQNRIRYAIRQFILIITQSEIPLIIFIDDWQWADNASVELLNNSMQDEYIQRLLLIASFRDNEIDQNSAFQAMLEECMSSGKCIQLALSNIAEEDTLMLLQDTLNARSEKIEALNKFIYARTEGNALYYTQFLATLRDENLIRFDTQIRQWKWNIEEIKKSIFSENIVELMIKKIKRYHPTEQKIMQLASCISHTFRLNTLSMVSGYSIKATEDLLNNALIDGLIHYVYQGASITKSNIEEIELKFAHDRIQQGIYEMLSQEEREYNHFKIGEIILQQWSDERINKNIFAITEQLNMGFSFTEDSSQILKIADLNWKASQKAKTLADFDNAINYSEQGLRMLERAGAERNLPLSIELYLQTYELAFLLDKENDILKFENILKDLTLTPHQQAVLVKIKVDGLIAKGELEQAIEVGLAFLDKNGLKFKKNPVKLDIIVAALTTQRAYHKNKIEELIELPVITDPFLLDLFRIAQSVNGAAYFSNKLLWIFMNIKTTRYYIKNGLCAFSGLSIIAYGASLIIGSQDIKGGVAFGKLALNILKKLNTTKDLNRVLFSYYTLISWWESPIEESLINIQEALRLSLSYGDFQFASHCCNVLCGNTLCTGRYTEHRQNLNHYKQLAASFNDYTNTSTVNIYHQFFVAISDPNFEAEGPNGEIYTLTHHQDHEAYKDHSVLHFSSHGSSLKYYFLMKEFEQAGKFVEKLKDISSAAYGTFIAIHTNLFIGLTKAAMYPDLAGNKQKAIKKDVKRLLKVFKKLSRRVPINFENKYLLLKGYYLRMQGKFMPALEVLQKAIELSRDHHFFLEEAIAWEACGDLYFDLEQPSMAKLCIQSAYHCFKDYGADAVCARLENRFTCLDKSRSSLNEGRGLTNKPTSNALAGLDLGSILKSSEALIGETDYEKLLKKLILIAIENAGAEKGYLLLRKNNHLEVSAYGDVDKQSQVFENLASTSFTDLSQKVVNYVATTKKVVILSDASNDPKFDNDEYLKEGKVKSVFSLPVLNKGAFVGLLYFENNIIKNAFTNERVELMKLLSGQIAISIENAVLVENLEEKVIERTLEIQREKDNSEKLLLNILPKATAQELQLTGKAEPRFYEEASVLFLDFRKFSKISKTLDFRDLVVLLDEYFQTFDRVIERFQIEKIKTIGDAYMCACGLPVKIEDHAIRLCKAAIEMQQEIEKLKNEKIAQNLPYFEARIGIHSGPVIAGVVGSKKFAYDIWGDTVNVAARLESNCSTGNIAISEQTYQLVKSTLNCEPKGKIEAKNVGQLEVYYLKYD